jgi:predicted phage tail protein
VGVVVKKKSGEVSRTFINNQVDVIRVNVAVRLLKQDKNVQGTEIDFEIWVQRNSEGWKKKKRIRLKEKASDYAPISYDIPVNNQNGTAGTWGVKIVKRTPDGDGTKIINDLQWLSFGQIVQTKLQYRHTAILATQLDSETFNSFPDQTIDQLGITNLLVPAGVGITGGRNLTYAGVTWTGATSVAANTVNDIFPTIINELTNPRINRFPLRLDQIDLSDLFEISKWNNTLITHQDGRQRVRFALTFYLADAKSGFDLLKDLCSSCFASYYWADGKVRFWQNRAGLPQTQQFSNADVVGGTFDYPETPIDTRFNVCRVSWWNPELKEEDEEIYEDAADIELNGYKETRVVALGCENRYQAWLYAKAVVKISQLEYRYCNFQASARAVFCRPGQILPIYDENVAQVRNGGLLKAWNGSATFTLDLAVTGASGDVFKVMGTDGVLQTLTVSSVNTGLGTVTTTTGPAVAPLIEGPWAIANAVQAGLYRVEDVRINDSDPDLIEITTINNVSNLWDVIENDADPLIPKVRGVAPPDVFFVKNLTAALLEVDVTGYDLNPDLYTLFTDWSEPTIDDRPNPYIQKYFVEFRVLPEGEWMQRQEIAKETTETRWAGLQLGRYQTRVTAVDIYGRVGGWVLSPEVLTANTAIVDSSFIAPDYANKVILAIKVQNLSNCSIKIWNTGSVAIAGYGIFTKLHSALNFMAVDSTIATGTLTTDYYESATFTVLSNSRNAVAQNNARQPVLYSGGDISAGAWLHLNVNTAGLQEIYIMARTSTGTTTCKVFYSGKPLSFDYY